MATRFHYFDFNGLGEGIRFLLYYGGVKFEDVRYPLGGLTPEEKAALPYGQMPIYEVPGKGSINQTLAIARYIAQDLNLVTGDSWRDAQLDALVQTILEFYIKLRDVALMPDQSTREAAKKVLLTETLDYYFRKFDKIVRDNQGFFGGKLTWVDFLFAGFIDTGNLFMNVSLQENYPALKSLVEKIHSYPGVKKYLTTRTPYVNPLNKS